MSDVFSGISFGQMFPSAGVPSNMSAAQASSGYAGPAANSQNYLNNLFATTQASLTTNAARMMDWARSPSAGYYGEGGGGNSLWSGGTGGVFDERNAGSGLTMAQLQQPWLTPQGGANNVIGGGDNNPFSGGSLFPSTSYTSYPTGGGVSAWDNFRSPANNYDMFQGGWGNVGGGGGGSSPGMLSSLGGGNFTLPSLDWTKLFGGGGGARTDTPYTMSPPGDALYGTPSPSTSPYTMSPSGDSPYTQPSITPPDQGPRSVFETGASPVIGAEGAGPLGGGIGAGGLNWGGIMGVPYQPSAEPNRYKTVGEQITKPYERYYDVTSPYGPRSGGEVVGPPAETAATDGAAAQPDATAQPGTAGGALTPGGGLPAADLAEQAKARLAKLMAGGTTEGPLDPSKIPALPDAPAVALPLARRRPDEGATAETAEPRVSPVNAYDAFQSGWGNVSGGAEADAAVDRPSLAEFQRGRPDTTNTSIAGKVDTLRNTIAKELEAQGLVMTSDYRAPTHELSKAYPGSAHTQGRAFDVQARTTAEADVAMGKIRELLAPRGLVEGRDYTILDEVRHPSAHATGPHVHTQFTEEGMQRYQQQVYQDPYPSRPPADIPVPIPSADQPEGASASVPLPAARPTEAPSAVPLETRPGVNEGQDISRPPATVKHSGLELARANIDTPIEKIAMERGGQKAVDQVSSMVVGMTPRQIYQSYGGMFMSRAEPLFASLGITRQDFEKAITMSPTRQDLKMRFVDPEQGVLFGQNYPAYTGPEAAPGGGFPDFRQSANVEDRRGEQLGRDQLAALQARGFEYPVGPEVAPSPLGTALGLGDLADFRSAIPEAATARPTPQERIDPTAPPTQAEQEYMELESRIEFNRNAQREGRPDRLPLDGPAPGRPDLPEKIAPDQLKTVPVEENTGLPDLPWSPSRPAEQRSQRVQQNMDELAREALKLQLPGEVGRRGYLNNPEMPAEGAATPPRFAGGAEQTGGDRTATVENLKKLGEHFGINQWSRELDTGYPEQMKSMPEYVRLNLLAAAHNTGGAIMSDPGIQDAIKAQRWDLVDTLSRGSSVLADTGNRGIDIQFGSEGQQPDFRSYSDEYKKALETSKTADPDLSSGPTMRADLAALVNGADSALTDLEWPKPVPQAAPETSMRDFQSPTSDYGTFQKQSFLPPWQASIPAGRNNPDTIEAVRAMATRLGIEPAAFAAMVQQETHDNPSALWNPQITPNAYGYRGLTQMGRGTFDDATRMGLSVGGFPTIEDYQRGTAPQQIGAYGDWLDLYTLQQPEGAAAMVNRGELAGLPPEVQAAIMQGTQFAPNATSWVRALEQGNMDMPTTATRQAPELRPYTVNAMADIARRHMEAWPQQQIWSNMNLGGGR